MIKWRLMKTAPKDGREVLTYEPPDLYRVDFSGDKEGDWVRESNSLGTPYAARCLSLSYLPLLSRRRTNAK